jgi:hypothetical protein
MIPRSEVIGREIRARHDKETTLALGGLGGAWVGFGWVGVWERVDAASEASARE